MGLCMLGFHGVNGGPQIMASSELPPRVSPLLHHVRHCHLGSVWCCRRPLPRGHAQQVGDRRYPNCICFSYVLLASL